MAIEEVINVSAAGAIDQVKALADAFESAAGKAAESVAKINSALDSAGAAGLGKIGEQFDALAAQVSGAVDKMATDMDRLGKAGAGGLDAAAASAGKAADSVKAVADSGKGAADGLKAAGDGGKAAATGFEAASAAGDSYVTTLRLVAESSAAVARSQKILADAGTALTTSSVEQDAALAQSAKARSANAKQAVADAEATQRKYQALALGAAAFIGYGIDQAAKQQTQITRLYTSAGESQKNLPMITQGILGMAGPTATDQSQLGQGAYWVESAGFHGQDALTVLRAVAQGAYAEGAPLQDAANAATSIMTSYGMYHPSQQQSNAVINQMLAAVGSGKMTMAGLSTALPSVLPVAASAGLSLPQVLGSLATMTAPGMSPDWAATNLGHTIGKLQNPTAIMTAEMYQLGLDPVKISQNLGKTGISGTMQEIQAAIKAHETKGGEVQLPAMNISKAASQDALLMLKQMPPAIQSVAKAYLDGGITQKEWMTDLKGQPPLISNLGHQFATVANLAHGYNQALKSGQPDVQAYNAAVAKTLGDSVAMRTYLELTGQHAAVTAQNIQTVSQSAKDAGQNVQGWADIQKTAGYQLKSFEYAAKATATTMGAGLLPAATDVMSVLAKGGSFLAGHKTLTMDLAFAGGGLGLIALGKKLASPLETALQGVGKIAQVLKIPGLDKLANIGQTSGASGAAAGLDRVAGAGDIAAASLDRLAGAADLAAGGETRAGAAGDLGALGGARRAGTTAADDAAMEAAGASWASKFKAIVPKALGRLAIGATVAYTGNQVADALPHSVQQAKAPIRVASDMAGGAITGSTFGPIGTAIGAAIGLWAGLGTNTNIARYPNKFSTGTQNVGGGNNVAFGKTGPVTTGPWAIGTETTAQTAPQVQPGMPAAGHGWHIPPPAPVKIPEPDLSSVNAAKTKAMTAMDGINSALKSGAKPVKVAAPDMSGVDAAKAKAMTSAQAITTAMETPLHKPVKAAAPNLSAFQAARGAAQADGAAISQGLAAGIQAGAGAAIAAAQAVASQVAAAMAHALQTRSPSRVTHKIGADASLGLAHGIRSHAHTVKAAVMSITTAAVSTYLTGLQGGQSAIDAAMTALGKGPRPQDITTITSTVAKLQSELDTARGKKIISKGEDSALTKFLQADSAKLQALATKRAVLMQEITNAQQIATQAISGASIMNAATALPVTALEPVSSETLLTGMQAQADQQRQFAQQVSKLKKEGLNATTLDQVIQSGATAGLPVTQGILGGGKSAIAQLNQYQTQIQASAASLGNVGGPAMYQAGVDAGKGVASGLKSQLASVDGQMKAIGTRMVNAVKAAVSGNAKAAMKIAGEGLGKGLAEGIAAETGLVAASAAKLAEAAENAARAKLRSHSPSLVFWDIGASLPQGLAGGVNAGTGIAESAVSRMAQRAAAGYGRPSGMTPYGGGGGTGGGGSTVINVTVNVSVEGSVTAERDLAATVKEEILRVAVNNWQTGVRLPGRAA